MRRALHNAAIAGDADITHALIAAGADVDAENEDKMTALSYAAWQNEARIVTLLVAAKADFECDGSIPGLGRKGMKPIHMASRKGSKKEPKIESVHALILAKACVTCQDDSGYTPLHYAVEGGDEVVVKMLLDANASLNLNAETLTVDRSGDKCKMTALCSAAWQDGHGGVVNLLIAAKADFECDGSIPGLGRKGMKPIHMASRKGSKKEPKIDSVHALILAKACVTCQDDSGSTPLMYAAAGGDERVVKMLLDANASLNMNVARMTSGGETALHLAAAYDVLLQVTMKNICFSFANPTLDLEYVGACRTLLPPPHSAHTQVQLHSQTGTNTKIVNTC